MKHHVITFEDGASTISHQFRREKLFALRQTVCNHAFQRDKPGGAYCQCGLITSNTGVRRS